MKRICQFLLESFSPNMDRYSAKEEKEFIKKIKDFFKRNAPMLSGQDEIKDNIAAAGKALDDTLKTYSGWLKNLNLEEFDKGYDTKFPFSHYSACIFICTPKGYYDAKLIKSDKILDVVILTNDRTYYIGGMSPYTELNAYKTDNFRLSNFKSFMCRELGCEMDALYGDWLCVVAHKPWK